MTPERHMTRSQEHRSYRYAVQASLETFYGKSKPEAVRLVNDWWKRLKEVSATDSDLFLHAEPIDTAAGLADKAVVTITAKNQATYHRVLDDSRDAASTPTHKGLKHPKTEAERRKQLVHVIATSNSSAVRGLAAKALAKKAKDKKVAEKQQVVFG
jgi:hypothetical protein